jgi:hypothetical protein
MSATPDDAAVGETMASMLASVSSKMDNAELQAPDAAPTDDGVVAQFGGVAPADGSVVTDCVNLELVNFLY